VELPIPSAEHPSPEIFFAAFFKPASSLNFHFIFSETLAALHVFVTLLALIGVHVLHCLP
jgi:hypothetical protein